MNLTLVYVTCRRQCKVEWFLDSLDRQGGSDVPVVVVDLHNESRTCSCSICDRIRKRTTKHVAPKPNVWNGQHRLTKDEWFACANQRNTGLCLCETDYICFADDLSVLMPGWLNAVREAMAGNYIALGAYKKVKDLVVVDGRVQSFTPYEAGVDSRWSSGDDNKAVPAAGSWLFGCSVAMPVEALLTINGWPEDLCDGMGSEDYCTGIVLQNAGYTDFRYDRRMLTLESEELHHVEKPMKRSDYGVSPHDKSHAALKYCTGGAKAFENTSFGPGGIRALRECILAGGTFPVPEGPKVEWFTGRPLGEL